MKKIIKFGILLLGMVLIFSCIGVDNSSRSIGDLLEYFEESGVTVREGHFQLSNFLLVANDGRWVSLNGISMEIYKLNSKESSGKTVLDSAKKYGVISILGDLKPCFVNGSFIIVPYSNNKEEIINISSLFSKFR